MYFGCKGRVDHLTRAFGRVVGVQQLANDVAGVLRSRRPFGHVDLVVKASALQEVLKVQRVSICRQRVLHEKGWFCDLLHDHSSVGQHEGRCRDDLPVGWVRDMEPINGILRVISTCCRSFNLPTAAPCPIRRIARTSWTAETNLSNQKTNNPSQTL